MPSLPDLLAAATPRPWLLDPPDRAARRAADRALSIYAVNLLEAHAAVAEAFVRLVGWLEDECPYETKTEMLLRSHTALARLAEAEKEQRA